MGIAVLGPLEIDGSGDRLPPRDRVVLSVLVVRGAEPSRTAVLADALWPEAPPDSWATVVHGCIARLRKRLGPSAIESAASGYRLTLGDGELDTRQFERLLTRAREALEGQDPQRASFLVQEALDLWRGPALADLEEWEPGRLEASRLDGMRGDAEELLVEAGVAAGRAREVLEDARLLVARAPLRERRWALLARALHQAGRQAEALGAIRRARATLAEQLGLDPGRELVELEALLLRQDPSLDALPDRQVSGECPYRGLLAYDTDDADTFFGREGEVAACLRRMRDTKVLAVVGPSGVGKSSLVLAGVAASLVRGGAPVLVTRPGRHPCDSLTDLRRGGRQTLVVDQAEEAVAAAVEPEERERYFAMIAEHAAAGGGLVLSLRADHLGDLAAHPRVSRLVESGLHLLGPMGESDLRSAIEGPAHRAGLRLEAGLVDLLVREAEGEPGALPLLSHALRETWLRREGPTLTVAAYAATGGIRHAVARTAESLYDAMDDEQRHRLRNLMLRLLVPRGDGDPESARVALATAALDEQHALLVEELAAARLLSIDGDWVQLAHEALVRVWPRLRGWVEDDVEGLRLLRHLAAAADAWDGMGRPESELLRGARLGRTVEWRDRTDPALSDRESAFLAASTALRQSEEQARDHLKRRDRRVRRQLRAAAAGMVALVLLLVTAGVLARRSSERAEADRRAAAAASDLANAQRAGAVALRHKDLATSVLLAASALQVDRSAPMWDTLVAALLRAPSVLWVRPAEEVIVDIAASPDGTLVAASRPGEGQGVLLLDAASLQERPFDDGTPASGLAFSPDSSLLAVAVNQWTGKEAVRLDRQPVRLHEMPSGQLASKQLGGFPDRAFVEYSLGFSADGRRVSAVVDREAQADEPSLAMVWDVARPERPVRSVEVPLGSTASLSPDGSRLYVTLTTPGQRPIRVYDVASGALLRSADPLSVARTGLRWDSYAALSPDGAVLAVPSGSAAALVDTRTLRLVGPSLTAGLGDELERLEYSKDGQRLAGTTRGGRVLVWDTSTGALLHDLDGGAWGAGFSADGQILYSGSRAWDLSGRRGLLAVGAASKPDRYAVSAPGPGGRRLLREGSGQIWFTDVSTGRETPRTSQPLADAYHDWSRDGAWLTGYRPGGPLRVWDTASGRLVAERSLPGGPITTAISWDNDQVLVNLVEGRQLLVLSRSTLQAVRTPIDLGREMRAIEPLPDGSLLAVDSDGGVHRIGISTGAVDRVAPDATLSPDTWDVEASTDGSRLLGPGPVEDEQQAVLLDMASWKRLGSSPQGEGSGTSALSADGAQVAALAAGDVVLSDGRTGARVATVRLPSVSASARIAYLGDGTGRLLVSDVDGRTWTLETRPSAWLDRACATAGRNLTRAEWATHFPGRPYRVTCDEWPAGT